MQTPYKKTDKVIAVINRRLIEIFDTARYAIKNDELNALSAINTAYEQSDKVFREAVLALANSVYESEVEDFLTELEDLWLSGILQDINKTVGYSYVNELERKRARAFESVVASDDKDKAVQIALTYLAKMMFFYADYITREAFIQAQKDNGVKRVKWLTEDDLKVCYKCEPLDGKVFDIEDVPPPQHWNCRCWLVAVE